MQSNQQIQPWEPQPLPDRLEPVVWVEPQQPQPLAQRQQPGLTPTNLNPLVIMLGWFFGCLGLAVLLAGVGAFIEGVHPAQFRNQQGVSRAE